MLYQLSYGGKHTKISVKKPLIPRGFSYIVTLYLLLILPDTYSYIWTPLVTLGIQGKGWAMAPSPLDSYLISSHMHFLVSQISFQNNIMLLNLKTQPQPETDGGTI
ncbi:MAG: hypothetical protein CMG71_01585 [Candidatus Marinimicrobia bacterium]|nr:hypothetical protein [Candidatus Neomarinimicrobiota bacterium]